MAMAMVLKIAALHPSEIATLIALRKPLFLFIRFI
jgi:hypothetical protein